MSYVPRKKLTEEEMRALAEKDGPASNAAFALLEAMMHDGPVRFYKVKDAFIVDRLKKDT